MGIHYIYTYMVLEPTPFTLYMVHLFKYGCESRYPGAAILDPGGGGKGVLY